MKKNGFVSALALVMGVLLLTVTVATLQLAQWHWRSARAYGQSVQLMYLAQGALAMAWHDLQQERVSQIPPKRTREYTLPPDISPAGEPVRVTHNFRTTGKDLHGYLQAKVSTKNGYMEQTAGLVFEVAYDERGRMKLQERYYRE